DDADSGSGGSETLQPPWTCGSWRRVWGIHGPNVWRALSRRRDGRIKRCVVWAPNLPGEVTRGGGDILCGAGGIGVGLVTPGGAVVVQLMVEGLEVGGERVRVRRLARVVGVVAVVSHWRSLSRVGGLEKKARRCHPARHAATRGHGADGCAP